MTEDDARKTLLFMLARCGYSMIKTKLGVYGQNVSHEFVIGAFRKNSSAWCSLSYIYKPYNVNADPLLFRITTKDNSWSGILMSLFRVCKSHDIFIEDNDNTCLLKKGTTPEQILVEMDLKDGLR